ncbi:MAG: hypothetical protein ACRCYU_20580 [Nocardioides sp.]
MLNTTWRTIAVMISAIAIALVGSAASWGNPPVTCPKGQVLDPTSQTCVIDITVPPGPKDPSTPPPPGDPDTPPVVVVKCVDKQRNNIEVPCTTTAYGPSAYWSNSWNCYVALIDPQPPKTDPVWQGHTDGAIYGCVYPWGFGGFPAAVQMWSATPPPGVIQPPDPLVLARRALAMMNLRAVQIGIVPEDRPGSVGIIGLPTWMWVQSPSQSTFGPITRSASAGGYTVTATAKVSKVVWSMGDGKSVTCTGPGTPYADNYGKKSSPTCGHTYTRQGRYTVTATSYWTLTWSGIGQSGTIPIDFATSTNVTMGESQVITQ